MKLYKLLFESAENDLIRIVGYHRNDNPDFSQSDITMEPRVTRQSKGGNPDKAGFYITMPKIRVDTIQDLPDTLEASSKALVRLIMGVERLGWILYGSDDLMALLGLWSGS